MKRIRWEEGKRGSGGEGGGREKEYQGEADGEEEGKRTERKRGRGGDGGGNVDPTLEILFILRVIA